MRIEVRPERTSSDLRIAAGVLREPSLAGWKVGVCVKEGLAADYKPTCVAPAATPDADKTDENDDYLKLLKERLKQ